MADKFNKRVLFNDGEGVVETDFNNMQDRLHAHMSDALIGPLCMDEPVSTVPDPQYCYAEGHACAPYGDLLVDNEVFFAPGMVYVVDPAGSLDGDTPHLVGHYVEEADIPDRVRPLAIVSPRWDVLSVSINNAVVGDTTPRDFKDAVTGALSTTNPDKEIKSVATFTWTQGVEGGGEPATPAGDVKICSLQMGIANAAISVVGGLLRDYRIPLGYKTYIHHGGDFQSSGSGGATYTSVYLSSSTLSAPSGFVTAASICPVSSELHRLARVEAVTTQVNGNNDVDLLRLGGGTIEQQVTPSSGDQIIRVMQSEAFPIWSNGHTAGFAAQMEDIRPQGLVLRWGKSAAPGNTTILYVRWHLFGR